MLPSLKVFELSSVVGALKEVLKGKKQRDIGCGLLCTLSNAVQVGL